MVFRIDDGRRFADCVEDYEVVLAAGGDAVDDDVGNSHLRRREGLLAVGLRCLGGLDPFGELLGLFEQCGPVLRGRGTHLLAGGFLFGAQAVGGRNCGPAGRVGLQQRVHESGILAPGTLRSAHRIRVFAQQLEVDHGANPTVVSTTP